MPSVNDVIQRVAALVARKYDGDYRRAFNATDVDHNGFIDSNELNDFLRLADVGGVARLVFVRGAFARVDTDRDGQISWDEFQTALTMPTPEGM